MVPAEVVNQSIPEAALAGVGVLIVGPLVVSDDDLSAEARVAAHRSALAFGFGPLDEVFLPEGH